MHVGDLVDLYNLQHWTGGDKEHAGNMVADVLSAICGEGYAIVPVELSNETLEEVGAIDDDKSDTAHREWWKTVISMVTRS